MTIVNATIDSSETIIHTVGGGETHAVLNIIFCNFDTAGSGTENLTVYIKPGGESISDQNTIMKRQEIKAGNTFIWSADEKLILDATDVVSAIGSSGSLISATLCYMDIS